MAKFNSWPKWARSVSWFKRNEDRGVGDTIYRMTHGAGVFWTATAEALGIPKVKRSNRDKINALYPY